MADRIFLRLSEKFALGADELQWILYRKNVAAPTLAQLKDWRGISFVRSSKAILLRCMREAGCIPSQEAQLALDALPNTFDAWKAAAASTSAAAMPDLETV